MVELAPVGDRFKNIGIDIRQHAYGDTVTVASYTAVLTDDRAIKLFNSATAQAFVIPPDSAIPFDTCAVLSGIQIGTGVVTVTAGAGVSVVTALTSLVSKGQNNIFQAIRVGVNSWVAFGGLGG